MSRAAQVVLAFLCCLALAEAQIVYQGCWSNADREVSVRALPFRAAANNIMDPDLCKRLAVNRFVSIFGLEWGRECWLDPAMGDLAMATRFGASANCTMPCSGDMTARCGGDFTADLYTINDPLPTSIPLQNISHLGCVKDNQLDRRMTLLWESNNSMSIDLCAHIAYSEEWPFFAVQWSSECWGGKNLSSSMSLGPADNCDMVCPGNANQTCGGALAHQLYEVMDKYWTVPNHVSPWDEPKPQPQPQPSLLTDSNKCGTGAAASSPGCTPPPQPSAVLPAVLSRLATLLWVMWVLWLLY